MGSVSEDELAGLEWMLELLPKLHDRDKNHELLQYFNRTPEGWCWVSEDKYRAFLNNFWRRPESWEEKPGAVVRMVTYGNFCLEAKKVLDQSPPTA